MRNRAPLAAERERLSVAYPAGEKICQGARFIRAVPGYNFEILLRFGAPVNQAACHTALRGYDSIVLRRAILKRVSAATCVTLCSCGRRF